MDLGGRRSFKPHNPVSQTLNFCQKMLLQKIYQNIFARKYLFAMFVESPCIKNCFYRTRVRSLVMLVTNSMTHSLTDSLTHGTFTFDIHRVTPETCDLWNISSESLGDMTWPKNSYQPTDKPTYLPIYLLRSTPWRRKKVTNTLKQEWFYWCAPGLWR